MENDNGVFNYGKSVPNSRAVHTLFGSLIEYSSGDDDSE
jgi:hypothetical protein